MQLSAYLTFNGNCEEAFKFYAETFGGSIDALMKFGGSPMEASVPADFTDKVAHVLMHVGDAVLLGSDAPPGRYQTPAGFTVNINLKDPAEADRIFAALAEGGISIMPISETFWAKRFGMVTDKYGTPWMVNCE